MKLYTPIDIVFVNVATNKICSIQRFYDPNYVKKSKLVEGAIKAACKFLKCSKKDLNCLCIEHSETGRTLAE